MDAPVYKLLYKRGAQASLLLVIHYRQWMLCLTLSGLIVVLLPLLGSDIWCI